jgi:3-phenylpropionate/trans-cinnamate dioxygenase ferredoxin component
MTTLKKVARLSELSPSSATRVVIDDRALAVVRIENDVYVIADRCSHADYSLSEGTVWDDECEIECMKHGAAFSLKTGEPQSFPATQPVKVYEVTISGDDVMVEWV